MNFSTIASPIEIPAAMIRTCTFVGWKAWEKRVVSLAEQAEKNPFMKGYILEKYGCEIALLDAWEHYHYTGRPLWPPESLDHYRFYSFIAMFSKLHFHLNKIGRKRLVGMARHGLKNENGLEELAFELLVLNNLMTRGFDITCNDLEDRKDGGTYDFLAVKDGLELEVECKYVSADIGRQIHRRRMYQLGDKLFPAIQRVQEGHLGGTLVKVTIPGKLSGSDEQQSLISDAVARILDDENDNQLPDGYEVTVEPFVYNDDMFARERGQDVVINDLRKQMKIEHEVDNKNMLLFAHPGHGAIVVIVQSTKKDRVLDALNRQLKVSAKDQFSGERPGALFTYLADLDDGQLHELARAQDDDPTGLQIMSNMLIDKRPTLHTVVYLSPGGLIESQIAEGSRFGTSTTESHSGYHFTNSDHPLAKNERLRVF